MIFNLSRRSLGKFLRCKAFIFTPLLFLLIAFNISCLSCQAFLSILIRFIFHRETQDSLDVQRMNNFGTKID